MAPLISIVIPVFNRAGMIARTIESCLAQTYPHFEIVLVDDCSNDELDQALLRYAGNQRVRLIRHQHNQGVSAARNSGATAARGSLIAFLVSDDIWQPDKLERQLALMAARKDDLECGYRFLDKIGDKLSSDAGLAFEATHLAHLHGRARPGNVLGLVLNAYRKGAIAPRSVLGILSRNFLGQAGQRALRDAVMNWWWRPNNQGAL